MKEFIIRKNEAGQRFDKYIKKRWRAAPQSLIYKLLRKKTIVLNGKKADGGALLAEGDTVRFYVSDETFESFEGAAETSRPLHAETPQGAQQQQTRRGRKSSQNCGAAHPNIRVLYQDDNIMLLDKPAGVLSQKSAPTDYSVVDFCLDYVLREGLLHETDLQTFRPGICSRLDRNTSGMMAAGVSLAGLQAVNEMIRAHTIQKYYLAVVKGRMPCRQARLEAYHTKDYTTNQVTIRAQDGQNADEADCGAAADTNTVRSSADTAGAHTDIVSKSRRIITEYEVLDETEEVSLLRVHLITGQTHQIRAHLAAVGHPLAGDMKYGDAQWNHALQNGPAGVRRQLLHSYELQFPACAGSIANLSGRRFVCPPSGDFAKALRELGLALPQRRR